jgi:plasmid maintenance system antidote protein VapI
MKFELGCCRLGELLLDSGLTKEALARAMLYKPERISDYMENKRVMPLQTAISIADTIGCDVKDLYELIPAERPTENDLTEGL